MFKPFVKLLCVAALANAVLAQDIFIAQPKAGTATIAGSDITVQLDKPVCTRISEMSFSLSPLKIVLKHCS